MTVYELITALQEHHPDTEVAINDLDTGYYVPIDVVAEKPNEAIPLVVIFSIGYHDDGFPWDDGNRKGDSF